MRTHNSLPLVLLKVNILSSLDVKYELERFQHISLLFSFFNSAELDVQASVMAPRRHEIMRVRERKVITIKTLGLNQKHITHFKH